jgi:hypothetical protein
MKTRSKILTFQKEDFNKIINEQEKIMEIIEDDKKYYKQFNNYRKKDIMLNELKNKIYYNLSFTAREQFIPVCNEIKKFNKDNLKHTCPISYKRQFWSLFGYSSHKLF